MNWRFRNEHREFLIAGWWLIWSLYCSCISVCTLLLLSRIRNPDTFVSFYADSCLCCIVWFVDKYIKEFRVVKVTRMMSGHDPKFWSSRIHSADWSSDFRQSSHCNAASWSEVFSHLVFFCDIFSRSVEVWTLFCFGCIITPIENKSFVGCKRFPS